jgi:hypothetical protein
MTAAKVRLAMAAMGQKETKVTDLCSELAITRQTLYRHVAPDGTLRKDGLKVVEGGRYGTEKKMTAATRLNPVFRPIATQTPLQETFWLGNVGADLCEKFDRLHFGIFRAGE